MTSTPAREEEEEARKQFENIFWRETVFQFRKQERERERKEDIIFYPNLALRKPAAQQEKRPTQAQAPTRAHILYTTFLDFLVSMLKIFFLPSWPKLFNS